MYKRIPPLQINIILESNPPKSTMLVGGLGVPALALRDKDLYTTTNKCLQCLIQIMYTVF